MSRIVDKNPQIQTVLKPILYTDIFDYPLTLAEVHKFLDTTASIDEVETWLCLAVEAGRLSELDGYYSLAHRPRLAGKRQERWRLAQELWPQAAHYGHWIGSLPFVTMVAVTGALAVDNPRDEVDDIDYLIITRPGRLWLCRAMIIMLVRYGRLRGANLCPNYIITQNVLDFEADFFTAREMIQMQPLYGRSTYLALLERNRWISRYFPQGTDLNLDRMNGDLSTGRRVLKNLGELMLTGPPGDALERWLQNKQISKHTRRARMLGSPDKVVFTADICKGHYDGHNHKTMDAYRRRIAEWLDGK